MEGVRNEGEGVACCWAEVIWADWAGVAMRPGRPMVGGPSRLWWHGRCRVEWVIYGLMSWLLVVRLTYQLKHQAGYDASWAVGLGLS